MSNPKSDTWSALLQSDQTANAKEGPSVFDRVASALSGAGNFATGFAAEQIHTAGQDFVSRVLLGESYSPDPSKDRDREVEKDDGLDR